MNNIYKKLVSAYTSDTGFTLVEIIVATTVFVSATMLFMGVFSTISNNTLVIENTRLAQQDARYAIEQISREIRNGWNYEIISGGKGLSYQTCEDDILVTYELNFEEEDDNNGYLVKSTTGLSEERITSSLSDVDADSFSFSIDQPAGMYPLVEIHMKLKRSEFDRFANELEFTTKVGSRVRERVDKCGI